MSEVLTPQNASKKLQATLQGSQPPVQSTRLSDMHPGESVIALVYGASGVGKTPFGGSAGSRTLYIDTGHGLETLMSPLFRHTYPNSNPHIVQISELFNTDGSPQSKAFDQLCAVIDWWLDNRYDDFDTVVTDEMSATRRLGMYKGITISKEMGRSHTKDSVTKYGGLVVPGIQDFGMEMNITEWLIATYSQVLKEAKKHWLVIAHERITYEMPRNAKGETIIGAPPVIKEIRPSFTGRTQPDDIIAYFDEVWYMEKVGGDTQTVTRIRPYGDEVIVAKTRHAGVFESYETRPDFLEMVARIKKAELHKMFKIPTVK